MKELLAEWVENDGILLALPHPDTDWNYIIDEAIDQYKKLVESFLSEGEHVILLCPC